MSYGRDGAMVHAIARKASLTDGARSLIPGERHLLHEWLDRITEADAVPEVRCESGCCEFSS